MTGPTAGELAGVPAPASLLAVSCTRTVEPTSAAASVYVCPVASGIATQLLPDASQRCHWWVKLVGLFVHDPFTTVNAWPCTALPDTDSDGGSMLTGAVGVSGTNTHAAPTPVACPSGASSPPPPISAVSPSEERPTPSPKLGLRPLESLGVSFSPCRVQAPPERVNTHAAPWKELSPLPPIRAVLPSEESATLTPNWPSPLSPVPSSAQPVGQSPTSFAPCWVHAPPERVNTHAAPALLLSKAPPISAVLPSPESAA